MKRILLVEDDFSLAKPLQLKLRSAGFEIERVADGDEALDVLAKRVPDLILLDLVMPKRTGFSVLEQIRANEEWRNIPVIVFSNLGSYEDIRKIREGGADGFLIKAHTSLEQLVGKISLLTSCSRYEADERYSDQMWP